MIKANEVRIGNTVLVSTFNVFPMNWICSKAVILADIPIEHFPDDPLINRFAPIELMPEVLEWYNFVKMPPTFWNGNGADYQPKTSGTTQQDYVYKNDFIFRFTDWFYTNSKNEVVHELSTEVLYGSEWYPKISEGRINCVEKKYLHELQNLYFALTGNELEIKQPQ